jgi:FkbM family methyltransferase
MTLLVPGAGGPVRSKLAADRAYGSSIGRRIAFLLSHDVFRESPVKYSRRLIAWRARCLLRSSAVVRLPEFGIKLFVPPVWRGSAKIIYVFRAAYERELQLLNRLLSSGDVFVDVGANYGIYTSVASRVVGPAGRVISFEPATHAYAVLQRNIEIGALKNVSAFRLALSNQQGEMVLRLRDDSSMNAIAHATHMGEAFEAITTSTLDAELARDAVRRVHMLKLDVEGAEELVLRGASSALRTSTPVVLFELNAEAAKALDLQPDGAWNLLREYGYRFFQLDERRRIIEMRTMPAGGNVVAIHRSSAMLARQLARPAVINIDQRIGARAEAIAFYVSAPAAREGPGEAHDEYLAIPGHLRASRA